MNRLPKIKGGVNIAIICEGPEEFDYLNRLSELGVWNEKYNIELTNAGGNGSIPARYQDKFQNGSADIVFVFCDTDKKPYEQYKDIKRKIDSFHGKENISDNIVFFGNPCTMQIMLLHFCDIRLKSASKHSNAPLIQEYTGITDYDAHSDQRDEMMKLISKDNYMKMLERVSNLSTDDEEINSSNFNALLRYLQSDDISWVKRINDLLD